MLEGISLHHGDLRAVLPGLAAASVDAVVTDPPYELDFMGRGWDRSGVAFDVETWRQVLRVLKPGGHLVAFGGTRTFHRMTVAIEDAGFEIRDCLSWLYGQGFPKSHDVSKAIDKAAGAERNIARIATRQGNAERRGEGEQGATFGDTHGGFTTLSNPVTDAAREWQGWGTALKPAWEPIVLARKPLGAQNVASNVLQFRTGAINVDGCRIGTSGGTVKGNPPKDSSVSTYGDGLNGGTPIPINAGRWPANLVLDDVAAELLDEQAGNRGAAALSSGTTRTGADARWSGIWNGTPAEAPFYGDTGGASRFFYVAKASRSERNAGLEALPVQEVHRYGAGIGEGHDPQAASIERNIHPTVKPIALMRWLVRLVTPPGGTVLDPFLGSGTTGCAAASEGFGFVGVEQSAEYLEIARRRIAHWQPADTRELVAA